ncbi:pyrroline-5-carboxylate reductase [Bacillus spongiae]|uniref:Pyrroline-5-carboxylate reductase n=1 Tax=Bacillus spongiae TaxID=2683610 RepID=A0ABU8HBC7_9BACI
MLNKTTVLFLGAGSMAEAMISGIIQTNELPKQNIMVSNRSNQDRLNELEMRYGITSLSSKEIDYSKVDVVVLAMKPKDIATVVQSIKDKLASHTLVLSVLAGVKTSFFEEHLQSGQPVIRVMPNTSSMLQESATAISAGENATAQHTSIARALLSAIGEVYEIQESKMDIFTGIAGSGPAYFYYLMEHIEKTGKEAGLEADLAREIGAQTILGAAKMILEREETPTQLRKNVTSPNGTTAAGLDALKQHGGGEAIAQAVKGATERSKELSQELEEKAVAIAR